MTYKKFLEENEAIDLLLSGRRDGLQLTTIYTFHRPLEISFNENFWVVYALGAHVGFERYDEFSKTLTSIDPPLFEFERDAYFSMGANALMGIEYRWLAVPATIGFDVKPYLSFINMRYLDGRFWDAAISIKYIF